MVLTLYSRFFAGQYQTGQFVLTLFSDYSLTKEKKHSNFKRTEQDKSKKDKKTHIIFIVFFF